MLGKDAYAEMFRVLESLKAAQLEIETDENEDRIQRNGRERIHRQAIWMSMFVASRHHRDPSGEASHDLSKLVGSNHRAFMITSRRENPDGTAVTCLLTNGCSISGISRRICAGTH